MLENALERMSAAAARRTVLAAGLLTVCLAAAASGEPLATERVPEPLRPWIDWALLGHEAERCPFLHGAPGSPECVWPAHLDLALGARQGSFVQRWRVHAEAWVPLPGDAKHWPQAVQVDGRDAPVVDRGGRPSVRLLPGSHDVRGELVWEALPELLQIPPETGLLALSQNGEPVAFPKRDAQGRLWLHTAAATAADAESRLEISVHRRITDEIPLRVTTRVRLEVSGAAREVVLGRALPEAAIPMSIRGPLPARLDPDGRLRVQVRPGSYPIEIEARLPGPVEALALPAQDGPWDAREEWVFDARPSLRLVTVEGAASLDPQQTELPDEWRALPAYAMEPGGALRFVSKRRGDSDPAPDRLALTRTWWLDFDGGGYTVTDRIHGAVVRSDRLGMLAGTELGRVAVNGRDQFITRIPGEEGPGVEIPRGEIEISADSRVARAGSRVPAVGWNQDFQSVSAELQLPPGWRLLHASGVDGVSWTWVTRWSLLDLFVVLVVSMAFLRLFGPGWGALALAGLALSYTEPGAPRWVWVAVLSGEALRRALVRGRLAWLVRAFWQLALVGLVLLAIPFSFLQIRSGCFPALEDPGIEGLRRALVARSDADMAGAMPAGEIAMATPAAPPPLRALGYLTKEREAAKQSGGVSSFYQSWAPDPKARITTGPGLPTWSWRSVALRWQGPVERGQTLRLLLAPPWLNLGLALLRVALLGALIWRVLLPMLPGGGFPLRRAAGATAALAALLLAVAPHPAAADLPSPELLNELRTRLLEKPACHPECAASPRLRLEIEPAALAAATRDRRRRADRGPASGQRARLGAGAGDRRRRAGHGAAPGCRRRALAAGRHRRASGDRRRRAPRSRHHRASPAPEAPPRGSEQPRLERPGHRPRTACRRTISSSPACATRARARTPRSSRRRCPSSRASAAGCGWDSPGRSKRSSRASRPPTPPWRSKCRCSPGESVTSPGLRAEDGRVFVSLGPGAIQTSWTSALDVKPSLELHAPDTVAWTETWVLDASPLWHVEAEGIPVIHQEASGVRLREWRPWPDERVLLHVTRPEGVEGPTFTLDGSQLAVSPGLRATNASLELRLRSSLGGQHAILLPEGAVLERVTVDGLEQPIRQEGREVMLPLTPGTRTLGLAWQEPRGIATRFQSPEVDLRAAERERRRHAVPARGPLAAVGERPAPGALGVVLADARGARGPGRPARPQSPHAAAQLALVALGNRPHAGPARRGRRGRRLADRARLARRTRRAGARALARSRPGGARALDARGARRDRLLDPAGAAGASGDAGRRSRLDGARAALVPGPGGGDAAAAVGAVDPAARLPRGDARLGALARDGAAALAALGLGPVHPRRSLARTPARQRRVDLGRLAKASERGAPCAGLPPMAHGAAGSAGRVAMRRASVIRNRRRFGPLKLLRSFRELRKARATGDPRVVLRFMRPFHTRQFERTFFRVLADPAGRRLLEEERSLLPVLSDLASLRALPEGSLGREYARFMEDEELSITRFRRSQPGLDERARLRRPSRLDSRAAPARHARSDPCGLGLRTGPARRDVRAVVFLGQTRARGEPSTLLHPSPGAPELRALRPARCGGRAPGPPSSAAPGRRFFRRSSGRLCSRFPFRWCGIG